MPRLPIPDQERPHLARFALAFAGVIVGWACLHDLYLIGIEPRHFTDYHRPLLPIKNHALLALQYASVATFGPGLAFGYLAWLACRSGRRTPRRLRTSLAGFAVLMLCVEIALVLLGRQAMQRATAGLPPVYPAWVYPDETAGILTSQTINVTAYWLAPLCGVVFLCGLWATRGRPPEEK